MVQATSLPRNEPGIKAAIGVLKQTFGDRLQTGQAIREQHGHTTTWIETQAPDAVVFPTSTEEVAAIVKTCAEYGVPVIPFGTGTSLEGHVNAPAGGISVDMARMDKILAVHAEDLDVVVQPGVTREQLNTFLRDQGLFFPIDPGANASLGGMAATRASGTNAVRYGTMKDNVLALEVVMADGEVIRTAQRAKKSSAGYDMTRLMVGSEGTLGLITEITLRLQGIPEAIRSARCAFRSVDDACRAVMMTIQYGIPVARIEMLDAMSVKAANTYSKLDLPEVPLLLLEFHGSEAGVVEQAEMFSSIAEEFGGFDFEATSTAEERNKLWQARHDMYWACLGLRPGAKGISTDVCVPISRLAECVSTAREKAEEMGLLAPMVGHVGDGNFHALLLIDMDSAEERAKADEYVGWLNDLAISMDGTCTGEHGIGQGKRPYLTKELGAATRYMAAVKAALDPDNILNPGKIISD
ncbi:MAG: FAD-linked oxidase C-terminal domain-containing protein [Pseudophaeobacter sp. bin_em_oilr2.035]|uniref:D-lactate dehydrogenase (cytochrome) n=1 Tax=Phaeobacter gallaeciensis TaxID=60890 RepID=A0ABD4XCR5_9RHOB|nr:FAD-linked oxidase C-terminal domain-containing protein [Phaeobacter gallaeciensis]MDF1774137.1 FAD-linked oxidase C-terminal domain-containing protein [Pseudophaeobacter sp. bin_em_oilr2.035]MDE4146004.1 FAD-linked oxidase C-terminal domain-containing protein [Phaeobacter gallaeciensis]MDE4158677.1 FAD-linked oxidase C-terminal domain-containing protein [Phaeobacter gallaeciensis]MDE4162854.1 FAD-linked oxidase C-terminal domain-containing protein [Phaeobacter gallaeciensis]MDE4167082.1 FA